MYYFNRFVCVFQIGGPFVSAWWGVHSGASHRMSCPLRFPSPLLANRCAKEVIILKSPLQYEPPLYRGRGRCACIHHCHRGKPHPSNKVKHLPVWLRWRWRRGWGLDWRGMLESQWWESNPDIGYSSADEPPIILGWLVKEESDKISSVNRSTNLFLVASTKVPNSSSSPFLADKITGLNYYDPYTWDPL